jgi:hypothetical protein
MEALFAKYLRRKLIAETARFKASRARKLKNAPKGLCHFWRFPVLVAKGAIVEGNRHVAIRVCRCRAGRELRDRAGVRCLSGSTTSPGRAQQQALIQQGRAARISSLAQQMAQSEVAEVWEKGAYGHPISLPELHRFRNLSRAMFMSAEDSFFQYERRVLHEEGFESFRKSAEVMMRLPGLQAMWRQTAPMLWRQFRQIHERRRGARSG